MATKISSRCVCRFISRSKTYHIAKRSVNLADPYHYDHELPIKMQQKINHLSIEKDGFASSWTKRWHRFEKKRQRQEHHAKDMVEKLKNSTQLDDLKMLKGKKKASKSNIRKARKAKPKENVQDEITDDNAEEYLQILERIRNGTKTPKNKDIQKHLPDVTMNEAKINAYLNQIQELNIVDITKIEKRSLLPSKDMVDGWYDNLNKMYGEILLINDSDDPDIKHSVFHLDLYTELLIAFGKIGRTHTMMDIYKTLKTHNLQITNDTLTEMIKFVSGHDTLSKQLWNDYLNDFRKGKIPERPTLPLFNVFMESFARVWSNAVYEVSIFYRMMTNEFNITPDQHTITSLLKSYEVNAPPRYKSAQKLFKTMREEFKLKANTQHYATMLSIISTKWSNFPKFYKDLEDVDEKFLKRFKRGIDMKRSMKLFNTVLRNKELEINSALIRSLIKACHNTEDNVKNKIDSADAVFRKYILLENAEIERQKDAIFDERFLEISNMKIDSQVLSELVTGCFWTRDYDKMIEYYKIFTTDERIKDRLVVDCELFSTLIDGISCDLRELHKEQKDEYERITMERIKWIENEMNKYDLIPNIKTWNGWFLLSKRIKLESVTNHLLEKMDQFMENEKYFEFDTHLLQSVIESLFANGNIDKALNYYGKYYKDIKLFNHWDLKNTGQKEIDFHGFRTGFACVAIRWILQNEYPPLNISKYLLEKYGNKNPNVTLIVGQGHHTKEGKSRLQDFVTEYLAGFYPQIEVSQYPNNPGQLVLKGDDIVRWRKYHGHQVDTLKVNSNLQMRLFI